jgi:arylsulfatase A-like enzyme
VVLVTVDTLRADHLGCYGGRDAHSPNFDTVAADGVRFETAVSPVPLTLPAHASLMTALDPPEHGVRHNALQRLSGGIPTLAERMGDAGYATAAFVGALVLDGRFGLDRGFETYDDAMGKRVSATVGFAERPADRVVDSALAWLETAPDRFFLWVHFYDPHADYSPPAGFASAFASRPYAGEIAFVDAQFGRLLGGIRSRWPDGGTLVAVTSDHGESLGEHREPTHSYTLYDATQRIPLLMSGPGLQRGVTVVEPVGLIDVAPTLLAFVAAEPLGEVAGRDLRPLIDGDGREERAFYVETAATHLDYGWSPLLGLRTARFKYIRAPRPELYDLREDPREILNLAPDRPETAQRLDGVLSERLLAFTQRGDGKLAVGLGEAEREQLRSLGYVVPERGSAALPARLEMGGPDPKDEIGALGLLESVQRDVNAGRLDQALTRLRAIEGGGVAVAALRASVAVATGDDALAERDARSVLALQPQRPDVWIILGRALASQARLEEARAAFEAAVLFDPESVTALTYLGRVHEGLGAPEAAGSAYALAARKNLDSHEPRWRLAVLRLNRGEFDAADFVLEELARAGSLDVPATVALATAEAGVGRLEAALRRLETAREQHPGDARLERALIRLRQPGDPEPSSAPALP